MLEPIDRTRKRAGQKGGNIEVKGSHHRVLDAVYRLEKHRGGCGSGAERRSVLVVGVRQVVAQLVGLLLPGDQARRAAAGAGAGQAAGLVVLVVVVLLLVVGLVVVLGVVLVVLVVVVAGGGEGQLAEGRRRRGGVAGCWGRQGHRRRRRARTCATGGRHERVRVKIRGGA